MKRLKISHFGPIDDVDVEIGDLTLLVGPQASGKSLFLQFLNLLLDHVSVIETLRSYGFTVSNEEEFKNGIATVKNEHRSEIRVQNSRYARKLALAGISLPKKVTPLLDTDVEYR